MIISSYKQKDRRRRILTRFKKLSSMMLVMLISIVTFFSYIPAKAAVKKTVIPQVEFASAPVTQYTVGDRVGFNIYAPNYGGRVEYRVVLWNNSMKTYYDLWNSSNGYPTRYYTKWQPYGNNIFTLGWIISEPGTYRITVYAKRVGIASSKAALKGMNCDSYKESVAFVVKPREATVQSLQALPDVTVNQGGTAVLPSTVNALMSDAIIKQLKVTWGTVDTTKPGTYTLQGTVEGTSLKASLRLIVNPVVTALNVHSVEASSQTSININLNEILNYTPEISRFSLRSYYNSSIRLYSILISPDKRIIQLSTDTLTKGSYYTLKIDNREYTFQVPYTVPASSSGFRVGLTAKDLTVKVNSSVSPDITVFPADANLTITSYNPNIARYDSYYKKIVGVAPGSTTFYVSAEKTGYTAATTTFTVQVTGAASLVASPSVITESLENNGGLSTRTISVSLVNDYFKNDVNISGNVIVYNLPQGMSYTVTKNSSTSLTVYISGNAVYHTETDDRNINIVAYSVLSSGTEYLVSNEVLLDFKDTIERVIKVVSEVPDKTAKYGTSFAGLQLPGTVRVILDNFTTQYVEVTWNSADFEVNKIGTFEIKGTLVNLPAGIKNPDNLKAKVSVTVEERKITSASAPGKTVRKGTTFEALALPVTVEATMDDGSKQNIGVTWINSGYNEDEIGEYTIEGTWGTLPAGVNNDDNVKASIIITVVENFVKSVKAIQSITVNLGTKPEELQLPEKVRVILNDNTEIDVSVNWDKSTFNGEAAATYTLEGELVNLPDGVTNKNNETASITVIVSPQQPQQPQ